MTLSSHPNMGKLNFYGYDNVIEHIDIANPFTFPIDSFNLKALEVKIAFCFTGTK